MTAPSFPPARPIELPPLRLPDGRTEPGLRLSVHEAGKGPAIVLCHGFPELAYSWRRQIAPLAEAGFRVIAPDQRGYGASERPEAIASYDLHHLTGDLVGLLDALELERAVFVGHDWGGFVVWALAVLHPERVAGVVGVNTPYLARPPLRPTELLRGLAGGRDERIYVLWFQQPGVADAVLARHTRLVFEKLMRRGAPLEQLARAVQEGMEMNPFVRLDELQTVGEPLLTPSELDHYVGVFERTGFTGGLNWYRNLDRNWETAPQVGTEAVTAPALMVAAEWDPVLRPELADGMERLVPQLERAHIPRCGHWTQQEAPDELNRILLGWLARFRA